MHIDYRKWAPGIALSNRIILSQCPVCGESCHERRTKAGYRFIHSGTVAKKISEKTLRATTRFVPDKKTLCKQTNGEHSTRPTYPGRVEKTAGAIG